ncbi:hypothetical protein PFISCL1PPCAC_20491 [Pristionchus fissidentatus]|uniref:Uncharacterized protein n=1 Tax=Pristionchus fissidentatus TaxID=1538716 RepID=A0AAV5WB23_9BILA|nr:hypothetical protein PFISCL1PPCAC_20491 [Pristionchus fissidentatus]
MSSHVKVPLKTFSSDGSIDPNRDLPVRFVMIKVEGSNEEEAQKYLEENWQTAPKHFLRAPSDIAKFDEVRAFFESEEVELTDEEIQTGEEEIENAAQSLEGVEEKTLIIDADAGDTVAVEQRKRKHDDLAGEGEIVKKRIEETKNADDVTQPLGISMKEWVLAQGIKMGFDPDTNCKLETEKGGEAEEGGTTMDEKASEVAEMSDEYLDEGAGMRCNTGKVPPTSAVDKPVIKSLLDLPLLQPPIMPLLQPQQLQLQQQSCLSPQPLMQQAAQPHVSARDMLYARISRMSNRD